MRSRLLTDGPQWSVWHGVPTWEYWDTVAQALWNSRRVTRSPPCGARALGASRLLETLICGHMAPVPSYPCRATISTKPSTLPTWPGNVETHRGHPGSDSPAPYIGRSNRCQVLQPSRPISPSPSSHWGWRGSSLANSVGPVDLAPVTGRGGSAGHIKGVGVSRQGGP
jgi:hypothetical protein